jgi:hypothetical protein
MFYFLNWDQLQFSAQLPGPWPSAGLLSLSPLGLGLLGDPACPLSPDGHESVAPCLLAASFTGKRLTSRRLSPSPHPANTRVHPSHLPPRADHCGRCLTCARSASRRRFRSHNGRSTPTPSSLPTTTHVDPLPKRPPSSPLWCTTFIAHSSPMLDRPAPPLTL